MFLIVFHASREGSSDFVTIPYVLLLAGSDMIACRRWQATSSGYKCPAPDYPVWNKKRTYLKRFRISVNVNHQFIF